MALTRKVRRWGPNSLAVVLPSQLVELCDIRADMRMEFEPLSRDSMRITKVSKEAA